MKLVYSRLSESLLMVCVVSQNGILALANNNKKGALGPHFSGQSSHQEGFKANFHIYIKGKCLGRFTAWCKMSMTH